MLLVGLSDPIHGSGDPGHGIDTHIARSDTRTARDLLVSCSTTDPATSVLWAHSTPRSSPYHCCGSQLYGMY